MAFAFENLIAYQKAVDFADRALAATEGFPRGSGFLADQLNRAAVSIATNLAEGNERFTKADRKHFCGIARGAIQECIPLLDLAMRRGLLGSDAHDELRQRKEGLGEMTSALISGLERRGT